MEEQTVCPPSWACEVVRVCVFNTRQVRININRMGGDGTRETRSRAGFHGLKGTAGFRRVTSPGAAVERVTARSVIAHLASRTPGG
jgi:hypothetical protein